MSVERLPSARERDARANLERMIAKARNDIVALGADLAFDEMCWDVTAFARKRSSSGHQREILYFTTHEGGTAKSLAGRTPMAEPFASFLKAVVRLRYDANPTVPGVLNVLIRAARYLHDVLIDRGGDPSLLVAADFLVAADTCRTREAPSSQYRIGVFLVEIADWLNRYGISKSRIDFRNPFPRVTYDDTRLGKEHDRRRSKKLPPPEALDALGRIANLVESPADVIRMRAIELLVCGGWRINELLTLPEHCEVEEDAVENGVPVLDPRGHVVRRYGIRYWPEKGAEPRIKWMPTTMVDVAKRAIRDLRIHTAASRTVAQWLEANPGRAFLPEVADLGPDQLFSTRDLENMFNLAKTAGSWWVKAHGLSPAAEVDRLLFYRRRDLEAALLADQRFPDQATSPLKLSEHLFIIPFNFFNETKGTNPCVVTVVSDQQIADFLAGRGSQHSAPSVFERFGFAMPDGRPIELTSHVFRHWLNTLAQQGGMGQHEIARWFGRKDIAQNAAYDHVSAIQLAGDVRDLMERGEMRGDIARLHESLPPADRVTFREAVVTTVHTTDLGMCINDWSFAPCPNHGSCANCEDHLVEKGNAQQKRSAEALLDEHEWILERAVAEAAEDTFGASNHAAHIRSMCEGLRRIIAVHDDTDVPDGTLVHVNAGLADRRTGGDLHGEGDA